MPIKNYGVLKGNVARYMLASSRNEHFQVLVDANGESHRIAINVKSQLDPPEVLFYMSEDFTHPLLDQILAENLPDGYTPVKSRPDSIAVDFLRKNLFDVAEMKPLPYNVPGTDNDLNEKLEFYIKKAMDGNGAKIFAFGEKWGPENGKADKYFGFEPGNGIHDIHMNQGNSGTYKKDNGVYQDGALFIHFPATGRWVTIFIAFQVQSFHTDDRTGDPGNTLPINDTAQPENSSPVRIIAALVNPKGADPGREFIILLNTGTEEVNLNGWRILDKTKTQYDTIRNSTIGAGETLKVILSGNGAQLGNKGGIITLLNARGQKIDGVTYTAADASQEGRVIEL